MPPTSNSSSARASRARAAGRSLGDDHQLGEQRVVVLADDAPLLDPGVDANARAGGHPPAGDAAGRRSEVQRRMLGAEAHLDGVALRRGSPLGRGQSALGERLAGRDPQLLVDQVDVGHELGHAVLHLEPGVDLEEPELAVRREQELRRGRVAQPDRLRDLDAQRVQLAAPFGRQAGRGRLLDQLLVAALDRAVALAQSATTVPWSSPSSCTSTWRARST